MTARTTRRKLLGGIAGLAVAPLFVACDAPGRGAARAWSRRIGFISGNSSTTVLSNLRIFKDSLHELGYAEDRDFVVNLRIAEGAVDRLPAFAEELVNLPADILVAEATPAALAAKGATRTIPVVFVLVNDPVGQGMVASLAHPGENVTGVSTLSGAMSGKRLEHLKTIVPGAARLAVLWNGNNPGMELALRETQDAARTLGLTLDDYRVRSAAELETALVIIARRLPDGMVVLPNFGLYAEQVVGFAAENRMPHIFSAASHVTTQGALAAFGPNYESLIPMAAGLVDKIFKGARPGELPVEQPTKFDFVINLATAQQLGLTIPESLLRQTTEVVR